MKKSDISKVEDGAQVIISERYKKFFRECAFEMNSIGGDMDSERGQEAVRKFRKSSLDGSFFAYMLVGNGYPYKAKILHYAGSVGGPKDLGFKVEISFKHGLKYSLLINYRDLELKGRKNATKTKS